jgi:hypothetical protein
MTTEYNPDDLKTMWQRIQAMLGADTLKMIIQTPPRKDAFCAALDAAIRYNDCNPLKVTDGQIIGALEIADEVWPVEAEAIATTVFGHEREVC